VFPCNKSSVKSVLLDNQSFITHCLFQCLFYWAFCVVGVFLPRTDFCAQNKKNKKSFLYSNMLPFGSFTLFDRGRKTCIHTEFLVVAAWAFSSCSQVQNCCREERRNLARRCVCSYHLHEQKVWSKIKLSSL